MIQFQEVTYTYPGAERAAIHGLNLEIAAGEFVLVAGASGVGKSTFLRCINGLVPHFSGGNLSGRIEVINGAGEWMEPISYRLGTKAFISGFANFAPEICVGIHNESMKGNFQKATEIAKKLRPLQYLLGQYVQEIGSASQGGRMYKEMAILCGFKEGGPRLPIMPIPDSYREKLLKVLTEGGFLRNDLSG